MMTKGFWKTKNNKKHNSKKNQKQMNFHWNLVPYQTLIHVWKEQVSALWEDFLQIKVISWEISLHLCGMKRSHASPWWGHTGTQARCPFSQVAMEHPQAKPCLWEVLSLPPRNSCWIDKCEWKLSAGQRSCNIKNTKLFSGISPKLSLPYTYQEG